jgi:hypothetical protein
MSTCPKTFSFSHAFDGPDLYGPAEAGPPVCLSAQLADPPASVRRGAPWSPGASAKARAVWCALLAQQRIGEKFRANLLVTSQRDRLSGYMRSRRFPPIRLRRRRQSSTLCTRAPQGAPFFQQGHATRVGKQGNARGYSLSRFWIGRQQKQSSPLALCCRFQRSAFGHDCEADIAASPLDVCFTPKRRHSSLQRLMRPRMQRHPAARQTWSLVTSRGLESAKFAEPKR